MQFVFSCQRLPKKLNFIKIWQVKVGQNKDVVCYRKKQSFRQCAWGLMHLVLKPDFRPKGGLWVCRKSQKISTASDQYFLRYGKKKRQGGVKLPPPDSRNRVKWHKTSQIIVPNWKDGKPMKGDCNVQDVWLFGNGSQEIPRNWFWITFLWKFPRISSNMVEIFYDYTLELVRVMRNSS